MIKIVIGEQIILLTSSYESVIESWPIRSCMLVFEPESHRIIDILDQFQISEFKVLLIQGNEEESLKKFTQSLKTIVAGGGIVRNRKNEILFIYRHKKWDLPKGKCEEDEDIELCALREVKEETGLKDVSLIEKFITTYHCYIEDQLYLKETHWFLMNSDSSHLSPQHEEGITKAVWVPSNEIYIRLEKTYETVKDIFRELENNAFLSHEE